MKHRPSWTVTYNGCLYGPFDTEAFARRWIEGLVPGISEPRYVVAPLREPVPPDDIRRAQAFAKEQGW